jgi:hypothetical protein
LTGLTLNTLSHSLDGNVLLIREKDKDLIGRIVLVIREEVEARATKSNQVSWLSTTHDRTYSMFSPEPNVDLNACISMFISSSETRYPFIQSV